MKEEPTLEQDLANLPPLPWELWTSCSFRRITGPDGKEGGVLHAYNQRSDNHPDLSMPEDKLFSLVRLVNALPELLSALSALKVAGKALESTDKALQVAMITMMSKGWWENDAGYLTDAALWIDKAQDEVKEGLAAIGGLGDLGKDQGPVACSAELSLASPSLADEPATPSGDS